uniref:Uncharacterized protein n=1 Tax=Emiliania huxleyi TaxID=2903 RepID=A0A7S3S857_EMIHU
MSPAMVERSGSGSQRSACSASYRFSVRSAAGVAATSQSLSAASRAASLSTSSRSARRQKKGQARPGRVASQAAPVRRCARPKGFSRDEPARALTSGQSGPGAGRPARSRESARREEGRGGREGEESARTERDARARAADAQRPLQAGGRELSRFAG